MMITSVTHRLAAAAVAVTIACGVAYAAEDMYRRMALELSESARLLANPKIAVLPFSYVDKRKSPGGAIISERLTTRLVKVNKFKVIERQLLESVLQELHLETTGIVDVETTKQLGKVLGVEAIITGTILDIEEGMVEVNARVIKTDTAEVIATSSVEMAKIWSDGERPAPQQYVPQQQYSQEQQYAPPPAPAPQYTRRVKVDSFMDLFIGGGSGKADVTFTSKSSSRLLKETDFMIDFNGSGYLENTGAYRQIKFHGAELKAATPPIGLRIGGFGKHWGGAMEISYFSHTWKQQTVKTTYNGLASNYIQFFSDEYMTISILNLLSGDLMFRFLNGPFQPYVGVGAGMSIGIISSQYISSYLNTVFSPPLQDYNIGFLYRFPMGIRYIVNDQLSLFAEYRPTYNYFVFDRGLTLETDEVASSYTFMLFGLGFRF